MLTAKEALQRTISSSKEEQLKKDIAAIDVAVKSAADEGKKQCIYPRMFIKDDMYPDIDNELRRLGYITNLSHTELTIEW